MDVYPSKKLIANLAKHGVTWQQVVADIECPKTVSPVNGYETRLLVRGEHYAAYVEPVIEDDHDVWLVVGVRNRDPETGPIPLPVVGVETPVVKSSKSGGVGNRWPSTWSELGSRLRKAEGVSLKRGSKHLIVEKDGVVVDVLPLTSSDHRALLNACTNLARKGLDVRQYPTRVGVLTITLLSPLGFSIDQFLHALPFVPS